MATEKILNTRVILKHDTLANWNKDAALILKEGEVALARVDTNKTDPISGELVKVPTYLIKVGDGTSKFSALNWVAAPAADVHDWAKKTEADFTAWVKGLVSVDDIDLSNYYTKGETDEKFVAKETGKSLIADTEITRLTTMSDGANKVEASETNGNIKIDGAETVVYTHPDSHTIAEVAGLTNILYDQENALRIEKAETKISDLYRKTEATDTALDEHTHTASEITDFDDTVKAYDYATKTEAQGYADAKDEAIAAAQKAGDDAQADVDTLEDNVGSVDGLSTTNKTVVGAINEVLAAVGTGGTAAVVTMEKSTDGLSYTIKQGDATVGTIDIPKDMVVTAGEVVTNPEGQAEGTYIKLTLANVADPLYINVGNLVDIYTAQANATQVQLAIDSTTREISATVVAGSITSTELANNAVITTKIADANVTKAKLSTEVQDSLDLADSAVQETDLGTMAKENAIDYVKKSEATGYDDILTKTEAQGAYQAKGEYYTKTEADAEFTNATEVDGQIDAKITALNLANTYQAKGDYATAEQGGKADTAVQTISTPDDADGEPNGLKAVKTGTDVAITIDDSVVWVFDCGDSGVNA